MARMGGEERTGFWWVKPSEKKEPLGISRRLWENDI